MATFQEALQNQSRVVLCNLLGGPESVPYVGRSVSKNANQIQRAINGFRKWTCNDSSSVTEPEVEDALDTVEIEGSGQCPTKYWVFSETEVNWIGCPPPSGFAGQTGSYVKNQGRYPSSSSKSVFGPLTFSSQPRDRPDLSNCGGGSGQRTRNVCKAASTIGVGDTFTATANPGSNGRKLAGTTHRWRIERVDGQPDDCAPAPVVPPEVPPYIPTPITVTIEYEDGDDITNVTDVDITFFTPILVAPVTVFAPVRISGNDFSLVGNLELTGDFRLRVAPELNFGGGGGSDVLPPEPDPELPLPEPNRSKVILGAIVTVTSIPSSDNKTPIWQGENPDIWIPRLGSVAFYVATENATAWTADIDVKNLRQFIPCPYLGGAVEVAGTPAPGWSFDITPVFAPSVVPELPGS